MTDLQGQSAPDNGDDGGFVPLGDVLRETILTLIHAPCDPDVRKDRIMCAREAGVIWDDEAEHLIAAYKLRSA